MGGDSAPRSDFAARYDFGFDRFQEESFDALDAGLSVVVSAPTGSGKTIVAEYGIERARRSGMRAFYTAPIKALSNQKFRDLSERYGAAAVGLLTGDTSIRPDADVLVMTTEVLRNMLYAQRPLDRLGVVVIDEVHFLQDEYRGPVWEEVIINLPEVVQLVCLSATVSNADELANWMTAIRDTTVAIVETHRQVPLDNIFLVDDRTKRKLRSFETLERGRPNPAAARLDASAVRQRRGARRRDADQRFDHRRSRDERSDRVVLATPGRLDVVKFLRRHAWLPAIYFIFSRRQCSEAAEQCVRAGVQLTTDEERDAALDLARRRLGGFRRSDLAVLGYDDLLDQLAAGVGAHHAGLIPAFKELVEECFVQGLIRLVFATETLAVGVNMPARAVVIDKLSKYNGTQHEILSPAQFTQLCGRAGRRGLDDEGAAVVLWNPYVRFDQVATLAATKSFRLRSAFRPTYNMVANLVGHFDEERARQFLGLSFAQFQADDHVVQAERELRRLSERLEVQSARAHSDYGDIDAYMERLNHASTADDPMEMALAGLRPGDVITIRQGTFRGPAAVVATTKRKSGIKASVVSASGRLLQVGGRDFDAPPTPVATVVLPGAFSPNQRDYRTTVGRRVKDATLNATQGRRAPTPASRGPRSPQSPTADADVDELTILDDPDLSARVRAYEKARELELEIAAVNRRVARSDASLSRQLDRVLGVMRELEFVEPGEWALTSTGRMLSLVYHENDLLICQAVRAGVFDGVDAPTLAGLLSVFVYEHRSPDDPPDPWFSSTAARERWDDLLALSDRQRIVEQRWGASEHASLDPTMFATAYGWVSGGELAMVLDDDMTGGDFVRTMRQLIDLAEQIAVASPEADTRRVAREVATKARRDVIAMESAAATPATDLDHRDVDAGDVDFVDADAGDVDAGDVDFGDVPGDVDR